MSLVFYIGAVSICESNRMGFFCLSKHLLIVHTGLTTHHFFPFSGNICRFVHCHPRGVLLVCHKSLSGSAIKRDQPNKVDWLVSGYFSIVDTEPAKCPSKISHLTSLYVFFLSKAFISCGHTTDFYLGKTDLPRANSSKICLGKFISGFVLPR